MIKVEKTKLFGLSCLSDVPCSCRMARYEQTPRVTSSDEEADEQPTLRQLAQRARRDRERAEREAEQAMAALRVVNDSRMYTLRDSTDDHVWRRLIRDEHGNVWTFRTYDEIIEKKHELIEARVAEMTLREKEAHVRHFGIYLSLRHMHTELGDDLNALVTQDTNEEAFLAKMVYGIIDAEVEIVEIWMD